MVATVAPQLRWRLLHTDLDNLWRAPVLLTGRQEAILVDGAFTLSAGRMLAEAVRASGKALTAVLVTCSDPDFYFSLGAVRAAFPNVPVVAPPAIVATIKQQAAHKVATWRDTLGDDGPRSLEEVVVPEPMTGATMMLEGHRIEIVESRQPGHTHLSLPAARTILGGVQIGSGHHIWMADAQHPEEWEAWLGALDEMAALAPEQALPGHMVPGAPTGLAAIRFTRDYIRAFLDERARAETAQSLIAAMRKRYPDLAMDFVLEMGAKVHFGEMQWP